MVAETTLGPHWCWVKFGCYRSLWIGMIWASCLLDPFGITLGFMLVSFDPRLEHLGKGEDQFWDDVYFTIGIFAGRPILGRTPILAGRFCKDA